MSKHLDQGQYLGEIVNMQSSRYFDFSLFNYCAGESLDTHYHENSYLSLPLNAGYFEFNNSGKKLIEPGQLIYRPAGYTHANKFMADNCKCLNVEIKESVLLIDNLHFNLPGSEILNYHDCAEFYKAAYYFQSGIDGNICDEIMMNWLHGLSPKTSQKRETTWFKEVIQILEQEPTEFHSIYSLSERVFVHPVYLARVFKENMGCTLGEYQLKQKLRYSLKLLCSHQHSIGTIALASGFYDTAHYIKTFKAYFNVTPLTYRVQINS